MKPLLIIAILALAGLNGLVQVNGLLSDYDVAPTGQTIITGEVENATEPGVVVRGDCEFRINGDLNDPAPLFTMHGEYDWLVPNPAGVVELKNGQSIDMFCSVSFVAPFVNATRITAKCLQGQYYLVDELIYPFSNFSCTSWPVHTARRTGRSCNAGTDLLEVGFEIADGFLHQMDICHDELNEVTRYVHHVLNPSSAQYQRSVTRPGFKTGDFYGSKNVDNIYTKVQQNNTISGILGMDASPYFNDTRNIYLARGHLAAKVDFIFGAPQRGTFYFVNAAPQWQAFNAGNWERVEDGVRKYVANKTLTADCYTGTWGVSTLPNVNGIERELYLSFDENNNGLIPVPMIYYRVVIDRDSRKGIVLVGVNNPHASMEQILNNYVICEDIGNRIDWINWVKEDLLKGYSYACSVPDFIKVVKDLPLDVLNTTGILGIGEEPQEPTTCFFKVDGGLIDPAPLFALHGQYEWIVPNPESMVILQNNHSFDMYCSESFVAPFENTTHISAQCVKDQLFQVNGTIYSFQNFSCTEWPLYTTRRTGRPCNGGTDLLEVGFEVEGGFLQTMDICHDEINEVTRYVHHVLNPSSAAYQHSVGRPRFIEGDFYDGKNVEKLYTKVQQNITFSEILGMDASPYFNDSIDIYMARGHMAAKVDFIFGSPQRATFFFVNAAPQWQAFNGGNWERVEDGVRRFVANNGLTTDCYTGIWGISTLPNVNGVHRELFLTFDENNNGLIPVPMIYFRVVIDRDTRKGIVLVGVNNPHASLEQILRDYVICEDIGYRINWLDWAKEDLYKGYSYACSVPDFIKVVKDLPLDVQNTTGILGIEEEPTCSFKVSGGLVDPAPLFAVHNQYDWIVPNPEGIVILQSNTSFDMYCSESFVAPFENTTHITAQCVKDQLFQVNGTIYSFQNFSCTDWPFYTTRRTGRPCNGGTDLLEVGFEVEGGFLQTMDICHDEINEVTRYVHHVLNPSSAAYQRSVGRPRFIEGDFYDGKNVEKLYTKVQQNITFSEILGMDATPYFNDSIDIYMARGHMAAKVDFIFGSPQRATFFFVNAAPQWQAFNGGNWERIEDGVRKFVANNSLTTDCYTGIWGISTLPDINGTHRELYLAFDENNNGLIPVPMIYFRVIIDRDTRKGIVLVGVNNPHASLQQILKDYVICEDIGNQIDWISWAKEDLYKGYSYACSVPDFIRVVKDLPPDVQNTTGILGFDESANMPFMTFY